MKLSPANFANSAGRNTVPSGVGFAARWDALAPRERYLSLAGAVLVAGAVLWWLALAPALGRLALAQAQQSRLDGQWQQMVALKAQAVALAAQPKMNAADALRALEKITTQTLGAQTTLRVAGDRVTVTLKAAPATLLAQWLVQVRADARSSAAELRLTKTGAAAWDGSVVIQLPAP